MRPHRALLIASLLLLAASGPARADDDSARITRLAELGKIWGRVKFYHPWLAYKAIDWDAAVLTAIPKVMAARDEGEYAAAVQEMLGALRDAATRVVDVDKTDSSRRAGLPTTDWLEGKVLLIHGDALNDLTFFKMQEAIAAAAASVDSARAVILDLRSRSRSEYDDLSELPMAPIANHIAARAAPVPGTRLVRRQGYDNARPELGYRTELVTTAAAPLAPSRAGHPPVPTIILTNDLAPLSPIAVALQNDGAALVVAQGALRNARVTTMPLGRNHEVEIRVIELTSEATADVVVAAGDDALATAQRILQGKQKVAHVERRAAATSPAPVVQPERAYDDPYPTTAQRILAVYRVWNVIHYHYGYLELLGDWDSVLAAALPRFEAAKNAREYGIALLELAARIEDGHTSMRSPEISRFLGEAIAPLVLAPIEGQAVVVGLVDPDAARAAGVEIGDTILAVDGEATEARLSHFSPYVPGARPEGKRSKLIGWYLLRGPAGPAVLKVRDRSGREKEVRLQRTESYLKRPKGEAPAFRTLETGIGYVDLSRLRAADADAAIDALMSTRAIIFDLRGYPLQTFEVLPQRLNVKGARFGATFRFRITDPRISDKLAPAEAWSQPIPDTDKPKYQGKVFVLIGPDSISQAEHECLFFEQAADVTFVGERTNGSNGGIALLPLPGAAVLAFTGGHTEHADGRQLQRVGIAPDVEVKRTIAGVRAGRDEVLERALQLARKR